MVCRSNDNYLVHLIEPIHFSKNLVNCRSIWRMFCPISSRLGQKRVNFINKNDARLIDPCSLEQLFHSSCPNSYNHFIKLRPRAVYEVNPTLSCNCSGQQSLPNSWVSKKKHPLRNFRSLDPVLVRMLNLSNQVVNLIGNFINPLDVREFRGFVLDDLEIHRLDRPWFLEDLLVQIVHGDN